MLSAGNLMIMLFVVINSGRNFSLKHAEEKIKLLGIPEAVFRCSAFKVR